MHDDILLIAILDDIARQSATPALEAYIIAAQQSDPNARLAAWNALDTAERVIVGQAYIRGTRRGIAA